MRIAADLRRNSLWSQTSSHLRRVISRLTRSGSSLLGNSGYRAVAVADVLPAGERRQVVSITNGSSPRHRFSNTSCTWPSLIIRDRVLFFKIKLKIPLRLRRCPARASVRFLLMLTWLSCALGIGGFRPRPPLLPSRFRANSWYWRCAALACGIVIEIFVCVISIVVLPLRGRVSGADALLVPNVLSIGDRSTRAPAEFRRW